MEPHKDNSDLLSQLRGKLRSATKQEAAQLVQLLEEIKMASISADHDMDCTFSTIRSVNRNNVSQDSDPTDLNISVQSIQKSIVENKATVSTSYLNAMAAKSSHKPASRLSKGGSRNQGPQTTKRTPISSGQTTHHQSARASDRQPPRKKSEQSQVNVGSTASQTMVPSKSNQKTVHVEEEKDVVYTNLVGKRAKGSTTDQYIAQHKTMLNPATIYPGPRNDNSAPHKQATSTTTVPASAREPLSNVTGVANKQQTSAMTHARTSMPQALQPSINVIMDKFARQVVDEGEMSYILHNPLDQSVMDSSTAVLAEQDHNSVCGDTLMSGLTSSNQHQSLTSDAKGTMPQEPTTSKAAQAKTRHSYVDIMTQHGMGRLPILPKIELDISKFSTHIKDPELVNQLKFGVHYDMRPYEHLQGHPHLMSPPYANMHPTEVQATTQVLAAYISAGYVEPCQAHDLYATSPIFTKRNQTGTLRLCLDPKELNKLFLPPTLEMESVFAALKGMKLWSTKIDFRAAYNHFRLSNDFSNWFGFQWNNQHYKFVTLPAGWNMSSYICQRMLQGPHEHLVSRNSGVACAIYIDDSLYQHDDYDTLKQTTKEYVLFWESLGIQVNYDKSIRKPVREIEWLGLKYSNLGLQLTDQLKTNIRKAMLAYQHGQTVYQYQHLIGLMTFASKVAKEASPLLVQLARRIYRLPEASKEDSNSTNVPAWDPLLNKHSTKKAKAQLKPEVAKTHRLTLDQYYLDMLQQVYDYTTDANNTLQIRLHPNTYMFDIAVYNGHIGLSTIGRTKTDAQATVAMKLYPELNPHAFRAQDENRNSRPYIQENITLKVRRDEAHESNTFQEASAIKILLLNCPERSNLILCISSAETYWSFKKGICAQNKTAQIISECHHIARQRHLTYVLRYVPLHKNQATRPARNWMRGRRHERYNPRSHDFTINWNSLYLRKGINNSIRHLELQNWMYYRYLEPQTDIVQSSAKLLEKARLQNQERLDHSKQQHGHSNSNDSDSSEGSSNEHMSDSHKATTKAPPLNPVPVQSNYRYRSERQQADNEMVLAHKHVEYTYFRQTFVKKIDSIETRELVQASIHSALNQERWSTLVLMEYYEQIEEEDFYWSPRDSLTAGNIPEGHAMWKLPIAQALDQANILAIIFRSLLATVNLFRKVPYKLKSLMEKLTAKTDINQFLLVKAKRGLFTNEEIFKLDTDWLFDQQYSEKEALLSSGHQLDHTTSQPPQSDKQSLRKSKRKRKTSEPNDQQPTVIASLLGRPQHQKQFTAARASTNLTTVMQPTTQTTTASGNQPDSSQQTTHVPATLHEREPAQGYISDLRPSQRLQTKPQGRGKPKSREHFRDDAEYKAYIDTCNEEAKESTNGRQGSQQQAANARINSDVTQEHLRLLQQQYAHFTSPDGPLAVADHGLQPLAGSDYNTALRQTRRQVLYDPGLADRPEAGNQIKEVLRKSEADRITITSLADHPHLDSNQNVVVASLHGPRIDTSLGNNQNDGQGSNQQLSATELIDIYGPLARHYPAPSNLGTKRTHSNASHQPMSDQKEGRRSLRDESHLQSPPNALGTSFSSLGRYGRRQSVQSTVTHQQEIDEGQYLLDHGDDLDLLNRTYTAQRRKVDYDRYVSVDARSQLPDQDDDHWQSFYQDQQLRLSMGSPTYQQSHSNQIGMAPDLSQQSPLAQHRAQINAQQTNSISQFESLRLFPESDRDIDQQMVSQILRSVSQQQMGPPTSRQVDRGNTIASSTLLTSSQGTNTSIAHRQNTSDSEMSQGNGSTQSPVVISMNRGASLQPTQSMQTDQEGHHQ